MPPYFLPYLLSIHALSLMSTGTMAPPTLRMCSLHPSTSKTGLASIPVMALATSQLQAARLLFQSLVVLLLHRIQRQRYRQNRQNRHRQNRRRQNRRNRRRRILLDLLAKLSCKKSRRRLFCGNTLCVGVCELFIFFRPRWRNLTFLFEYLWTSFDVANHFNRHTQ